MAQSAYAFDFSLFEPTDYGTAAPQLEPAYEPEELPVSRPVKKKKKQSSKAVSNADRKATYASFFASLKVIGAVFFVFSMICVAMYLNARLDETANAITAVESEMKIVESEHIRLASSLEGMVSIDKVEDFAENNLGMVKLENYKITYFDSDNTNQVVISGGKSYEDSGIGSKFKKLAEYIF